MKREIVKRIKEDKIVAVIRMDEPEYLVDTVNALYEGGITLMEVTLTVPNAIEMISTINKEFGDKIVTGVGSVLSLNQAEDAIEAGAKFVVSPIFKEEIVTEIQKKNVPVFPGCFTPSEIYKAYETGAEIMKVFPADIVGMNFIKAVKAPIPHINLMPTGGVNLTNIKDWLNAGACAVGIGSALVDKNAIKNGDFNQLKENAIKAVKNLK